MGRRRTTLELQKLKIMDGSPELTNTKAASSKKRNTVEHKITDTNRNSSLMVTRARRKRKPTSSVALIDVTEINDETKPIEDGLQKATYVLTPKMFFSKSYERTRKFTKLPENKGQNDISAVKKSRHSTIAPQKGKNKSVDKDDFHVVLPSKTYNKAKQCFTKRKNIENKSTTLSVSPKQTYMRTTRGKSKGQMTTEEVIKELTRKDKFPVKGILLPVNEKDNIADQVNLDKSVNNSISAKRFKVENKQKSRLSLADIVKEIFPDSPEKKSSDHKVISDISNISVSSQKHSENDQRKKVSNDANKINDEWDNSLLLITDDFNSSGNVYDFEEFQMKKPAFKKCDKNKSIKKTAAMKAVFNGKKVNKKLVSQKKIKKSNTKTTKIKPIKKIVEKKMSPVSSGNPAIGHEIFNDSQQSSINNDSLSAADNSYQTPTVQMIKGLVSITELEKLKATKHTENKRVSKVNHGGVNIPEALALGWPQLPDLPSQQPVKLKRAVMEGPTAADNLPENKPKSIMIKISSPFNQSLLNMSSMDSESSASKTKPPSKKAHFKLSEKSPSSSSSADNQSIDLFTYPVALPTKKQGNKVKKNDECKEKKETTRKLMDFMYPGSVVRYLGRQNEDTNLISPPPVMLPKFLQIETSTPKTMDNSSTFQKIIAGESMCISPVKDFQSPPSARTYEYKSRRNSSTFLSIIKNVEVFKDEPKENSLQEKKNEKVKTKKKDGHFKKNKKFDEWASKMSNEFDEIEHFEFSIEG